MANLLAFVFLAYSASLLGAKGPVPVIPPKGEDKVLTGGLTAREFFEKRASDAACIDDLKKEKAAEGVILAKVADLKSTRTGKTGAELEAINKKIDALEPDLNAARNKMLERMEICGECATRPVELVESEVMLPSGRPAPGKTEKWYVSNGSCQIPSKDPKVLANAYKILSETLIQTEKYPKSAEGGFANILRFRVADPTTLKMTADNVLPAATPEKPINMYIWVLGPTTLEKILPTQIIFHYYLTASHANQTDAKGFSEFNLDFETSPEPRLKGQWSVPGAPEVFDTTLSGRERKELNVQRWALKRVKGQWYVTSDGYIRYFTAAEFGVQMTDIETIGRRILVRTLSDAIKRTKWEAPL